MDILSFNKYDAWYDNGGDLDVIIPDFIGQAEAWYKKHNKPVLLTEYGADTLEGLHFVSHLLGRTSLHPLFNIINVTASHLHLVRGIPNRPHVSSFPSI